MRQHIMRLNRREILAGIGAAAAHSAIAPSLRAAAGFPRRDDFAIPAGTAYLNAAMIHPMPRLAVEAIARGMQLRVSGATVPSFAGGGAQPLPKVAFATLINAKPSEITYSRTPVPARTSSSMGSASIATRAATSSPTRCTSKAR